MVVEVIDDVLRQAQWPGPSAPFPQTAAGGCARVLRIKGQQHQLVQPQAGQSSHRFCGRWFPVAHGNDHGDVEMRFESLGQCQCLSLGLLADRRTAADGCVVFTNVPGSRRRDQPGQRPAR